MINQDKFCINQNFLCRFRELWHQVTKQTFFSGQSAKLCVFKSNKLCTAQNCLAFSAERDTTLPSPKKLKKLRDEPCEAAHGIQNKRQNLGTKVSPGAL
eukprot:s5274_g4.t1